MYCKHCGKQIAEDSTFCQYCGGKVESSSVREAEKTDAHEIKNKSLDDKDDVIKQSYFQQQHAETAKRVGWWTFVCIIISLLALWESGSFYWIGLLQWIFAGSMLITIGSNWEEIKSFMRIKKSTENHSPIEREDLLKMPGRKYCAFTGNVINGEYVLVKHKHVVDESTRITRFGMFGQHTKRTTSTTYYWEAYYVDSKEYYKYKHSFGYICYVIVPIISFILPLLLLIVVGIGHHDTEVFFQFTIFGTFISLIPFQITRFFLRIFVEPNLKKIGLVDSMDVIDSYISTKHPKTWNVIRYLQDREGNSSDVNKFRFSKLPEFKSQII